MNLGGVVSPRTKQQQKSSNSPAPATVPLQSPNTNSNNHQQTNQQQTNLLGSSPIVTAQQPQSQHTNIQQIQSALSQTMKEQPQQPMVIYFENSSNYFVRFIYRSLIYTST